MTRTRSPLAAKRAKLTPKERVAMWQAQHGLCACGCGEALNNAEGIVGEHRFWLVCLGNPDKPDGLYRKPCAAKKTNGPRGDLNTAAHIRRIAEGRTQADKRKQAGGSRIKGRGFTAWRDFAGNIKSKDQTSGR